jgi:hypothetical protein
MISFAEHQKNVDHFYGLGQQAYEIYKESGAIKPWARQYYTLESVEGDEKSATVTFKFEAFDQGGTDEIYIKLPYSLIDNWDPAACLELANQKRAEITAAEEAGKLQAAAHAADKERFERAKHFIHRAEELTAAGKETTALDLAAAMQDPALNSAITTILANRKVFRENMP